jgi:carbamoyl-phosphate synthase large subunit
LLNSFRSAAKKLGMSAFFVGADTTALSSALQLCDIKCIVKSIRHTDYLKQLLRIVKQNNVKLLVPTIDTDLLLLTKNKTKFARLGCRVLVSELNVVEICQDKRKAFRFLKKNGFDTPETITARVALRKEPLGLQRKRLKFPCFLKPWDGNASRGNAVVKNRRELAFYAKKIPNCIVQPFIDGDEYTCDIFVDFDMKVRCVVPRKRIFVRGGEVNKGRVIKHRAIMSQVAELVEKLDAGPGLITVQLILTADEQIKFIEINPRFGGGAPLAIKAGADFPRWILQQMLGKRSAIKFDGFKDNLVMLRYDAEVWL